MSKQVGFPVLVYRGFARVHSTSPAGHDCHCLDVPSYVCKGGFIDSEPVVAPRSSGPDTLTFP
jgi:hypothetical protein